MEYKIPCPCCGEKIILLIADDGEASLLVGFHKAINPSKEELDGFGIDLGIMPNLEGGE